MLLNGGAFEGVQILKPKTVQLMTTNQIGDLVNDRGHKFGLGFQVIENPRDGHPKTLKGACGWSGFFTTDFCVAPKDKWILVAMLQTVWNDNSIKWVEEMERRAACAVAGR
jgi:CubicO group peptidase (beta-lactamase class C family)